MNEPETVKTELADRGRLIQKFASIEYGINDFIARRYSKEDHMNLMVDILEDPYFSTELRLRIFKAALKKYCPEKDAAAITKPLKKLQELRNIIAHAVTVEDVDGPETGIGYYLYKNTKVYVADIHAQFDDVRKEADAKLAEAGIIFYEYKKPEELTSEDKAVLPKRSFS